MALHRSLVTGNEWLEDCQDDLTRTYRALIGLGADPDEAADAVQDALEAAIHAQEPIREPLNWLFVVARRRWSRSRWRRRLFRPLKTATLTILGPTPDAIAVIDEVRRLPERQRAVIVYRYVLGFSQAETASALGVATGTVAATAHTALRRLRERLG